MPAADEGVGSMCAKAIAVKKYIVTLSADERERLQALIRGGKHPARKLMRARILLKADASEAGEAWSDSKIAEALDTGLATVARVSIGVEIWVWRTLRADFVCFRLSPPTGRAADRPWHARTSGVSRA